MSKRMRQTIFMTAQGFPVLEGNTLVPNSLIPFKIHKHPNNQTIHFFLDDFRFESCWNYPDRYINYLKKAEAVLTPDFSLYLNYPNPIKIYNTYRNRWLGAYWESQGINIIPCVSWADQESFEYCFQGIPQKSVVAIASMGIRKNHISYYYFLSGLEEMINQLSPSKILVYGEKFKKELEELYKDLIITYPHYRNKR